MLSFQVAENEGFEPPVPCGTIVFKTTAFDHSANSPRQKYYLFFKLQAIFSKKNQIFLLPLIFQLVNFIKITVY